MRGGSPEDVSDPPLTAVTRYACSTPGAGSVGSPPAGQEVEVVLWMQSNVPFGTPR